MTRAGEGARRKAGGFYFSMISVIVLLGCGL